MNPIAAAVALAVLASSPCLADQPLLRPNRDVDVTYRAAAQGGKAIVQRVRWSAAAQAMRIDPPAAGMHVIIDYAARRMSVVREATRSVIDMAAPDSMADALGNKPGSAYLRGGQATVAGRACTEWRTRDRDGRAALVCITDDGVLLRAGTAEMVRVSAVSVRYAPQDPAAFRVPPDYAHRPAGAAR